MKGSQKKIRGLQKEMNTFVVEREAQVEALLACLISGNHLLLLGPPGTGKSLLANTLCEQIDGANYFQWLLTMFSVPEELFGPVSMTGLKNDEYRRVTTGKLPEAHVGFLDEIWKANSAILNSMLTAINERKFHNNGQAIDIPLLTCVGASNELPQGEELGALYDRFLVRFWVDYIESDDSFIDLVDPKGTIGRKKPVTKLSLDEIAQLGTLAQEVVIPADLLQSIRKICKAFRAEGINASDRRWKSATHMLRAFALLRGLKEVTGDELELLADMMWDNPEDRRKILQIVAPYGNPLNLKAVEFLDQAKEIYTEWNKNRGDDTDDSKAFQANGALKEIMKEVQELIDSNDATRTKKLTEAYDGIRAWRTEVITTLDMGE